MCRDILAAALSSCALDSAAAAVEQLSSRIFFSTDETSAQSRLRESGKDDIIFIIA